MILMSLFELDYHHLNDQIINKKEFTDLIMELRCTRNEVVITVSVMVVSWGEKIST